METYYFLAVICCLVPFIIGGIWFAMHDLEKSQIPTFSSVKVTPQNPEEIMVKGYSYINHENALLHKLEQVNTYSPDFRTPNTMDHWFKRHTGLLCHDGECLAYINRFGHIEDTFWKNIEELGLKPEENEKFQRLLISISYSKYTEKYHPNFRNLLFNYGKRYKLMPKILKILDNDPRFAHAKETYENGRKYAV